ncbi:MAG: tRNA lysidine(34) synthetase TilS [Alphaproteobacteria bacterium]|nr:tRNA lysidine(34) synthetase TilS [Alphaproteobacteria bacterium]
MEAFLNKHYIKDKIIAVGVSGGADSLALALKAAEELKVFGRRIIALTVDHHLRPSSTDEARFVAEIMRQHDIEHHILSWDGEKPTTGIEEAARIARYNLIQKWCDENGVKTLMTAHHLYDQIETFLMRLQRGSGLEGLCCIREVSFWNGLTVLRPFIHTKPQELQQYLQQRHISWIHDESNDDENFLRVKMRRFIPELVAQTQITPERFDEAVSNLQSAENFISTEVKQVLTTDIENHYDTVFSFKHTTYLQWHPELKFRLISRLCKRQYIPRADSILSLIAALNKLPFSGTTLGGKEIIMAYKQIWILPELAGKRRSSRQLWKDFTATHPSYKNKKIPHKARLAILEKVNNDIQ